MKRAFFSQEESLAAKALAKQSRGPEFSKTQVRKLAIHCDHQAAPWDLLTSHTRLMRGVETIAKIQIANS